jgi:Tol biopolymer transport system component
VYVMNADGTSERRLTNDHPGLGVPFFSPDGSQIIFTRNSKASGEIWIMNSDGKAPVRLVPK